MQAVGATRPSSCPSAWPTRRPTSRSTSYTGSGPYIFKTDEYRPGEKVVYVKNTKYVPRKEPPSGTAGGKMRLRRPRRMDHAERRADAGQRAHQRRGRHASRMPLRAVRDAASTNPKLELGSARCRGSFALHLNHHIPPFDNPKIAQAALHGGEPGSAAARADGVQGPLQAPARRSTRAARRYASDKTAYFTGKPQFEKAKALLKEAGYDGKPIVLMYPTDFTLLNKLPPVMAQLLKQAGFNVDMQSMDWPTLVDAPRQEGPGRARAAGTPSSPAGALADNMNPMFFAPLTGNGEKGWFGWTNDDEARAAQGRVPRDHRPKPQRKRLATAIQQRVLRHRRCTRRSASTTPLLGRAQGRGQRPGAGAGQRVLEPEEELSERRPPPGAPPPCLRTCHAVFLLRRIARHRCRCW